MEGCGSREWAGAGVAAAALLESVESAESGGDGQDSAGLPMERVSTGN